MTRRAAITATLAVIAALAPSASGTEGNLYESGSSIWAVGSQFSATVLSGPVWGGTGNPVSFTINIPPNYSLVGEQGYIQGLLRDPSSAVPIGLTEAVEVQFGL